MNKGIISVLSAMAGVAIGAGAVETINARKREKLRDISDKHLALFLMMNQWVNVKQEGKNLSQYFSKNDYKKIAIYGMSYAGETLINELKATEIEVLYGIDQNADKIHSSIDVFSMNEPLDEVDAVVVTPIMFFDEISDSLSQKMNCPIICLEDILYEI